MTTKPTEEKILTLNLNGKKGVNILKSKYDEVKKSIVFILSGVESMTMSELSQRVANNLEDSFDGKIGWYYMAVKLDLEVRGVIARVQTKFHKH
jgi:hypothetical protein